MSYGEWDGESFKLTEDAIELLGEFLVALEDAGYRLAKPPDYWQAAGYLIAQGISPLSYEETALLLGVYGAARRRAGPGQ